MLRNIKNELLHRLGITIISAIALLILETLYLNEVMLIMLSPMKDMHNDWHNAILYDIINNTYRIFDTMHVELD